MTALGPLEALFQTTETEHADCAKCEECADSARVYAQVSGSTGGTYIVTSQDIEHAATVTRVPLMPVIVPLVSLKAHVISDIRHAEQDVPLIYGSHLTDAGIHYLNSLILHDEHPSTGPNWFHRKSWREGLVSA